MTSGPIVTREALQETFDRIWNEVVDPNVHKALEPLREARHDVPRRLLHFTSAAGLEAILRRAVLRLSRSRSSNDPMELKYGLAIAERLLRSGRKSQPSDALFVEPLSASMRGEPLDTRHHALPDPHICCFTLPECESSIPQWALYGQNGAGFVLVFDGQAIATNPAADFVPVIYRGDVQEARLRTVIEIAESTCAEVRNRVAGLRPPIQADNFIKATAHLWGNILAMHAAAMKESQFAFEIEWRAIRSLMLGVTVPDEPDKLTYGVVAHGRVLRSFYELPFERTALKEIIVGSTHHELNEPVVRAFLEDLKYPDTVDVRRGTVALRV